MRYEDIVKKIANMILSGIWYSDAYELVFGNKEASLCNIKSNEQLESDIDVYIASTGKRVPLPKYHPIF